MGAQANSDPWTSKGADPLVPRHAKITTDAGDAARAKSTAMISETTIKFQEEMNRLQRLDTGLRQIQTDMRQFKQNHLETIIQSNRQTSPSQSTPTSMTVTESKLTTSLESPLTSTLIPNDEPNIQDNSTAQTTPSVDTVKFIEEMQRLQGDTCEIQDAIKAPVMAAPKATPKLKRSTRRLRLWPRRRKVPVPEPEPVKSEPVQEESGPAIEIQHEVEKGDTSGSPWTRRKSHKETNPCPEPTSVPIPTAKKDRRRIGTELRLT